MDLYLVGLSERLTRVETTLQGVTWALAAVALPIYGQLVVQGFKALNKKPTGGRKTMRTSLLILFLAGLASTALAAPLNLSLDPTTHGMVVAGASLVLTEAWKKLLPKISGKASPWVAIGMGVAGAAITGFGQGMNIGQVGAGILCGGAAMATYDLGSTITAALQLLGIKKKN